VSQFATHSRIPASSTTELTNNNTTTTRPRRNNRGHKKTTKKMKREYYRIIWKRADGEDCGWLFNVSSNKARKWCLKKAAQGANVKRVTTRSDEFGYAPFSVERGLFGEQFFPEEAMYSNRFWLEVEGEIVHFECDSVASLERALVMCRQYDVTASSFTTGLTPNYSEKATAMCRVLEELAYIKPEWIRLDDIAEAMNCALDAVYMPYVAKRCGFTLTGKSDPYMLDPKYHTAIRIAKSFRGEFIHASVHDIHHKDEIWKKLKKNTEAAHAQTAGQRNATPTV